MSAEVINVVLNLVNNFNKGIESATKQVSSFRERVDNLSASFAPISLAAGAALGFSAKAAVDFDKSVASASRSMNLSTEETKKFANAARELSRNMQFQFGSTEIANVAGEAGKLGVASNEINKYTEAIIKLAVATDNTQNIEKLNTNIAKIKNVFRLSTKDVEIFGAAVNKLGDSTAANANQIVNFTQRVAGSGYTARISAKELAAWGATLISAGKAPESAATFMNKFLSVMGAATNLSKPAQDALNKLGYSASELAAKFDENASVAMQEFITRVKNLDSISQREVLGKIFGQEHVASAQLLIGVTDQLNENLKNMSDTTGNLNKLNNEFSKMSESVAGQTTAFKNAMSELGITLGSVVLPSINGFLQNALIPLVKQINMLVEKNPLIGNILTGLLAFAATITPILALVSAIAKFISLIGVLKAGLLAIGTAISLASVPILPFIGLIAGIAGAVYAIYRNWSPISKFFSNIWNGMYSSMNNVFNWMYRKLKEFTDWLANIGYFIQDSAVNWGKSLITGFVNGLESMYGHAQNAMENFTNWLRQFLPSSDAKKGALSDLTASGKSLAETFMNGVNSFGIGNAINSALSGSGGAYPTQKPAYASFSPTPASNNVTITNNYQISGTNEELIKMLKKRDRELLDLIRNSSGRINRNTY